MYGLRGLTSDLAAAIQRFEGSCPSPTSCRNNNPGNLRAYAAGQPVDSRGIRIFPTYEAGEAALLSQVDTNIGRGLSLSEFFGGKPGVYPGYAPAADSNDPTGYAQTVAGWLGIDPNTPLGSVSGETTPVLDAPVPSWDFGGTEEAGLSPVAMAGLGIAALGILWAVTS